MSRAGPLIADYLLSPFTSRGEPPTGSLALREAELGGKDEVSPAPTWSMPTCRRVHRLESVPGSRKVYRTVTRLEAKIPGSQDLIAACGVFRGAASCSLMALLSMLLARRPTKVMESLSTG